MTPYGCLKQDCEYEFSAFGGFVGFSGTTGGRVNYHRFDNLEYKPACLY